MAAAITNNSIFRRTGDRSAEFLILRLGHEQFALQIARVREIMQLQDLVEMPGMPSYIRGLITVHGVAVPVLDLRARLGLPERAPTHRTCIIIVRIDGPNVGASRLIGLLVDGVSDILSLDSGDFVENRVLRNSPTPRCRRKIRVKTLLDLDTLLPAG